MKLIEYNEHAMSVFEYFVFAPPSSALSKWHGGVRDELNV